MQLECQRIGCNSQIIHILLAITKNMRRASAKRFMGSDRNNTYGNLHARVPVSAVISALQWRTAIAALLHSSFTPAVS